MRKGLFTLVPLNTYETVKAEEVKNELRQVWIQGRWKKKRDRNGKKRPLKHLQGDSLEPNGERRGVKRGSNSGEALCLGRRRTQSLNIVMEWNSKGVSHQWAPLLHHSSLLRTPPPLFLVTFSNLLMCPRCAAVCLLLNNWQLCHICQCLSFPLLSFFFPPHSLVWWLLPLFSISCPISTSQLNAPSPALKSGYQLHFTNYHSKQMYTEGCNGKINPATPALLTLLVME